MLNRLESYFEFPRLKTNWRTEILAGVTTFLTMAYIVLVNPASRYEKRRFCGLSSVSSHNAS